MLSIRTAPTVISAVVLMVSSAEATPMTCAEARQQIKQLDAGWQAAGGCPKKSSIPTALSSDSAPTPVCTPNTAAMNAYLAAHKAEYDTLKAKISQCNETACPSIPAIPTTLCPRSISHARPSCVPNPDLDGDGIPDDVESSLIARYSPDLHFSVSDDGRPEAYRPMDPITYVEHGKLVEHNSGRLLIPNTTLQSNPSAILSTLTLGMPSSILDAYIMNLCQPDLRSQYAIDGSLDDGSAFGADWDTIMKFKNVGLFAHVSPFIAGSAADLPDADGVARKEDGAPVIPDGSEKTKCARGADTCYKIEYYQFFGLNEDYASFQIGDHQADLSMITLTYDATIDRILTVSHWAHGYEMRFDLGRYPVAASASVNPLDQCPVSQNVLLGSFKTCTGPNAKYQDFQILKIAEKGGGKLGAVQDEPKKAQNNTLIMSLDPGTQQYTHPVVFVEFGAHEFWPTSAWSAQGAPSHNGADPTHHYIAANVSNLGEIEHPMGATAQIFIEYDGYWGNWNVENDVSPGPSLHASWNWYTSTLRRPLPPSQAER